MSVCTKLPIGVKLQLVSVKLTVLNRTEKSYLMTEPFKLRVYFDIVLQAWGPGLFSLLLLSECFMNTVPTCFK